MNESITPHLFKATPASPQRGGLLALRSQPRELAIPARHRQEFVMLFYALEALRLPDQPMVLQFVGPSGGVGTSVVASGFARVANTERQRPVLYIDCSPSFRRDGPSLAEMARLPRPIWAAVRPAHDLLNVSWARLSHHPFPLLDLPPAQFEEMLNVLRKEFPVIILDCPSLDATPDSAALSRYSDATVLVVQAEVTRQSEIKAAQRDIERHGGQIIGVVMNRQRSHLPRWMSRGR